MDTITKENESEFVTHIPCEECGSSDANSLYNDGHTHCFSCGTTVQEHSEEATTTKSPPLQSGSLLTGSYSSIDKRNLSLDICRKYDYFIANRNGEAVQVANYRDKMGNIVAQKVRTKNKDFSFIGEPKKAMLFGSHLFANKGKLLVICEGEIDTLSASACLGKYHAGAVGLPNGCASAVKAIKDNYDFVSGWDKVVLCFDQDEAGRKASLEACQILPVGKA
jgi:twinkle protein